MQSYYLVAKIKKWLMLLVDVVDLGVDVVNAVEADGGPAVAVAKKRIRNGTLNVLLELPAISH